MAVNAGDKVRAVHLSPLVDTLDLPDNTVPSAAGTWEDWGNPLIFANPGTPVTVMAWGTGSVVNDDGGSGVGMRIGISTDGGATYEFGQGPRDQAATGGNTRRGSVSALHTVTTGGIPSGDVRVKAQIEITFKDTAGGPAYWFGSILGQVIAR